MNLRPLPPFDFKKWFQLDLKALFLISACVGICMVLRPFFDLSSILTLGAILIAIVVIPPAAQRTMMLLAVLMLAPHCWLLFDGDWKGSHLDWFRMWPTLPGLLPSRFLFFAVSDLTIQYISSGFTLIFLFFATLLARINESAFWIVTVSCFVLSCVSSYIEWQIYRM